MKLRDKISVWILVLCGVVPFAQAQKVMLVKASPICANQYEYQVNGLSTSDKHISYHVQQNAYNKVILNTAQANPQQVATGKEHKVIDICDVDFTPELIQELNKDKKRIYMVYEKGGIYMAQKVSSAVFVEEDNKFIRYSGPYYSFTYNKTDVYDPAERLAYGIDNNNKQAQFLANSTASIGCHKTFNLIKVINQTHPKNSFSMIANDDFKKMTSNQIVETCQKPLNVELAEGIGIIQEKTINCDIQLMAINGQSLNQFLSQKCNGTNSLASSGLDVRNNTLKGGTAIMTKPSISKSSYFMTTEPVFQMPPKEITRKFDFTENTAKGYSAKEVETKKPGVYFYSAPIDISTAISNKAKTGIEGTQMRTKEGNVINIEFNYEGVEEAEEVAKEEIITTKGAVMHEVNNGDTLYNISQKYNTTVDVLKNINQLENNTIYVTQQLRIK